MPPSRFHSIQYICATFLCALFGIAFAISPDSRSDGLLMLSATAAGFLFGKFSNGFKSVGKESDAVSKARAIASGGGDEEGTG